MKEKNDALLLTVHGFMEFIWRYAWAGFAMFAMTGRPVPLFEALGAFFLAAIVTRLPQGKGWRIVSILALQAICIVFAAGVMVHAFYYGSFPFWSEGWIREFFASPRTPLEWIMLIIFGFWILIFWSGGVNLTRKPSGYYTVCARFDTGLAALLVLYLLEWLLLSRGGIQSPDPLAKYLIFPYFLFSVFAIGLARNRNNERREYLAGHRGVGIISTVLAALALMGTAIFMLFLPVFTAAAETGYAVIKGVAAPLGPVVVGVLRFLFMGRKPLSRNGASSGEESLSQPLPLPTGESSWWEEILEGVLMWSSFGLVGTALLVLMAVGGWALARWLLSRTSRTEAGRGGGNCLSFWLETMRGFLYSLRERFHARGKKSRQAPRLFAWLRAWGRRSGVPPLLSETPGEYGARLKQRFPALKAEVDFIIDTYHKEVYGKGSSSEEHWNRAGIIRRRLISPVYWPSRLQSWFL